MLPREPETAGDARSANAGEGTENSKTTEPAPAGTAQATGESRPDQPPPQPEVGQQPPAVGPAPMADEAPPSKKKRAVPGGKSRWLACILSILPGLGHVYVGYMQQGIMLALLYAASITIISSDAAGAFEPFFGIFLTFLTFYAIIDAGRRASAYNNALAGIEVPGVALPSESMGWTYGSRVAGGLLILFGLLLLLHTLFGVTMAWVADFWPLALIGFGIYIFRKGTQERRERGE
jgi:hypothetical protein